MSELTPAIIITQQSVVCPKCSEVVFVYAKGVGGPAWVAHFPDTHRVQFCPPTIKTEGSI